MFTGIVEKIGKVSHVTEKNISQVIGIRIDDFNSALGDSICINGVCLTVEDIDVTVWGVAAIYEFTKDSKFTPIIMSGLSYQSGTDALVSVQTGGQNTNFTVSSDELWALQLGGGFIYVLKEDIGIYTKVGTAIPLSNSDLPEGWTEESPTVFGFNIGLMYSF